MSAGVQASPRAPWYRPRSLRGQFLLWLVPLHLAAALVSGWASYASYGGLVRAFMDEQMEVLARSHAAHGDGAGLPRLSNHNVFEAGAFVVQLWSAEGRLIASSRPDVDLALQAQPGHHTLLGPHGALDEDEDWRVYTAPPGPGALRVQVLQSQGFLRAEIGKRALYAGVPIALLVPLMLLLLWAVVARASRSLRSVADEIARRDESSLGEIEMTRVPEEITPLVASFNMLLARLRAAFATQRRFVQDAAHELRTPMTAIALQLENYRPFVPAGEAGQQFAQLEAGLRRGHHLVEQLLRLSRQEGAAAAPRPGEPIDLIALLRDSVGQLMPLADRRRIEVGFEGRSRVVVRGAALDLRSVFDNLLDNALRYTQEGGEVEVRLYAAEGAAVVDVVDNGPGLPAVMLERVFDRFFRMPGASAGGSGLGLAIARAAALRQGLRVELRLREDGRAGLVARVHLPFVVSALSS